MPGSIRKLQRCRAAAIIDLDGRRVTATITEDKMASMNELSRFRNVWEMESQLTIKLLEALPAGQYDFRPDPGNRSIGEMGWHLSEVEGYISYGIANGAVTFQEGPPNMQRPREVKLLAPGYRRVHEEAVARLANLSEDQLDREIPFADRKMAIRDILWGALLMHLIHHRGQLSLMCRMAGGTPPGIYGPNREEMAAMRERMQAAKV
jgi:uncharacterized damage-inducible protein DinB